MNEVQTSIDCNSKKELYCNCCNAVLPLRARFCGVCGTRIANLKNVEDNTTRVPEGGVTHLNVVKPCSVEDGTCIVKPQAEWAREDVEADTVRLPRLLVPRMRSESPSAIHIAPHDSKRGTEAAQAPGESEENIEPADLEKTQPLPSPGLEKLQPLPFIGLEKTQPLPSIGIARRKVATILSAERVSSSTVSPIIPAVVTATHPNVLDAIEASASTPSEDNQQSSLLSSLVQQAQSTLARTPIAVVAVAVALVTFFIHGYRLNDGPDLFSDEGLYLQVGLNLARGVGLVGDHVPFLYHPPAYLLIEAAYIKLTGLTNTDMVTALFSVRYLNVFFSAITATVILFFGRKLHSYKAGLIMVALFLLDPYVQRINRRNMLETFAMLCLLIGFYLFCTTQQRLKTRQWLGAGIAFGLAVLTKEAMFAYLLVLLGIAAWARRTQWIDAVRVIAIACLLYLFYPLWEIASGEGRDYFIYKFTEVGWVISSFTGHGLPTTSQRTFSLENLQNLLGQYITSYLLVALAGMVTVILFLRFRHLSEARYLFVWSIFSFASGIILARNSDQYLYFLIIPTAIIVNGYGLTVLFEFIHQRRWWRIVASLLLCLLFIYDSGGWATRYAYSFDNGYAQILAYVQAHIPPSEPINLSDDVGYYLLPSNYNIRLDRDEKVIIEQHEHYFIMSSKDSWGGYNGTTPQFYDWVIHNSQPLLVVQDNTFWTIGLYYMKQPGAQSYSPQEVEHIPTHPYSVWQPDLVVRRKEEAMCADCSSDRSPA